MWETDELKNLENLSGAESKDWERSKVRNGCRKYSEKVNQENKEN